MEVVEISCHGKMDAVSLDKIPLGSYWGANNTGLKGQMTLKRFCIYWMNKKHI